MSEEIWVSSHSADQRLRCLVEGHAHSVWMYLHDVSEQRVLADAPVCRTTAVAEIGRGSLEGLERTLVEAIIHWADYRTGSFFENERLCIESAVSPPRIEPATRRSSRFAA